MICYILTSIYKKRQTKQARKAFTKPLKKFNISSYRNLNERTTESG